MTVPANPPASRSQTEFGNEDVATAVRRIRFLAELPPGTKALRSFTQPHKRVAVEEVADFAAMKRAEWPEPTERLDIVLIAPSGKEPGPIWQAPPDHPDAPPVVMIDRAGIIVQWRPGRAVIQAPPDKFDDLVAGLADFAFYEGELRTLERAVEAGEADAAADTARAFRIESRQREHWPRFAALVEHFARLRLTYARLTPRLAKSSRSLPPDARGLVKRLLAKADVDARLEALSDRLEACEDLYEGATDRVADYRWYHNGNRLEWGIILLLMLEVILISADLVIRYLEYQEP